MADRYLKHVPTGQIFVYQAAFATREDFVEVADLAGNALPEAIEGDFKVVEEPKPAGKKKKLVVAESSDIDDIDAALSADASRGL